MNPKDWMTEFAEFASSEPVSPPRGLEESVLSTVHGDLNPSAYVVFAKLAAIHAVMGFVTLLFCPQFGLALTDGAGLMGLFMRWGDEACMLGCGAVFMSGSAAIAAVALRPEEVRTLRKNEFLQLSTLALLSIGVFICFGVGIVASLAGFWALGSIIGALASLELGWLIRARRALT